MTKRIYREIHTLRHLNQMSHPNIINLIDVIPSANIMRDIKSFRQESKEEDQFAELEGNGDDLYLLFDLIDTDLSQVIKSNQYLTIEHVR